MRTSAGVDAAELARELRSKVRGEVRFDAGTRALYATGASSYRQVPIGVVVPKDVDDVIETIAACRNRGAPVLSRGGGTSLAGQAANVAVLIDFSKYMHDVLEIDPERRLARVQPGVVLDQLRALAEERHGLTFGPDPSTHDHCTLGGMIGNNSCGVRSVMADLHGLGPRTSDNVAELEILTYDGERMRVGSTSDDELDAAISEGGRRGEIYTKLKELRDRYAELIRARYPDIPRRVSGYNLDDLLPEKGFNVARALSGTECTCVTVLEATVHLLQSPPARSLLVLGYPDAATAGDQVMEVLEHKPLGLEGIDDVLVQEMKVLGIHPRDTELLPEGNGWLLVEFGGESGEEAADKARELVRKLEKSPSKPQGVKLFDDPAEEKHIWEVREAGLAATAFVPGKADTYEGWEDSAVPPEHVGSYLRDLRRLLDRYGYACALYGHYGQGCIHTRIDFDLRTADGIRKYRAFVEDASDIVLGYGGSLSGEHGDGQSRAELLPKMFGEELVQAFREFKSVWDPDWKMNPGKVVDPHAITDNLRLGTGYRPPLVKTHFSYPADGGSFAHATLRCVGIGKCRRAGGGTMCPSYMVTREEKHTTRGRARMLFEMLEGDPVTGGWRDENIKDALDLCLACKGCKRDCPVGVDMATYKAEFLAHHYASRLRPRSAYAFGLTDKTARLGSRVPKLVNFATGTAPISRLVKAAAGMAAEREAPRFAETTFRRWFAQRPERKEGREEVILWPDTFTNHFHLEVGVAATEVLETAGFAVSVPAGHLCCGRPLYDYGMLTTAKRYLRKVLHALEAPIEKGVPLVGLEPSCLAVFRDELPNLLSGDENARRLSRQSLTLAEFLQEHAGGYDPPKLGRKAVMHGHCHQKSLIGMEAERRLLERMDCDFELLDSGCCGMAGSFGFEADHYDISVKCGERVLLPAVRACDGDTLIIADGFSCREQIRQQTDRRAMHLAEVLSTPSES